MVVAQNPRAQVSDPSGAGSRTLHGGQCRVARLAKAMAHRLGVVLARRAMLMSTAAITETPIA